MGYEVTADGETTEVTAGVAGLLIDVALFDAVLAAAEAQGQTRVDIAAVRRVTRPVNLAGVHA